MSIRSLESPHPNVLNRDIKVESWELWSELRNQRYQEPWHVYGPRTKFRDRLQEPISVEGIEKAMCADWQIQCRDENQAKWYADATFPTIVSSLVAVAASCPAARASPFPSASRLE